MDCPACRFSCAERPSIGAARLFQCRHCDRCFRLSVLVLEAFIALDWCAQARALRLARAARVTRASSVPTITLRELTRLAA